MLLLALLMVRYVTPLRSTEGTERLNTHQHTFSTVSRARLSSTLIYIMVRLVESSYYSCTDKLLVMSTLCRKWNTSDRMGN